MEYYQQIFNNFTQRLKYMFKLAKKAFKILFQKIGIGFVIGRDLYSGVQVIKENVTKGTNQEERQTQTASLSFVYTFQQLSLQHFRIRNTSKSLNCRLAWACSWASEVFRRKLTSCSSHGNFNNTGPTLPAPICPTDSQGGEICYHNKR